MAALIGIRLKTYWEFLILELMAKLVSQANYYVIVVMLTK